MDDDIAAAQALRTARIGQRDGADLGDLGVCLEALHEARSESPIGGGDRHP
jgi:hypothetical protein